MNIDPSILLRYQSEIITVQKGEHIFEEGKWPHYFYQIVKGRVKMYNYSFSGKEFIQGIFTEKESFGEPPIFCRTPYPASAMALTQTEIVRINLNEFGKILDEVAELKNHIISTLSTRLMRKATINRDIVLSNPEQRILTFLESIKPQGVGPFSFQVPYTRQEIANFTGLRVETVIRTLAKLKSNNQVMIMDRKVFI